LQQDIKDSIDTAKGIHKESSAKQVKKKPDTDAPNGRAGSTQPLRRRALTVRAPAAAQSGPRGELQAVNKKRQEKIGEKKKLREQMSQMKRIEMVSRPRLFSLGLVRAAGGRLLRGCRSSGCGFCCGCRFAGENAAGR
jgi:hypothetical protein